MSKIIEALYDAWKTWNEQRQKRLRFLAWREQYLGATCPCYRCKRIP